MKSLCRGSNVAPPSKERDWKMADSFVFWLNPCQNRYTVPVLSVRIVHPVAPASSAHLPDAESVLGSTTAFDQVAPPSAEVARVRRTALEPALGPPTKFPKQTYTCPKKPLVCAVSAHI